MKACKRHIPYQPLAAGSLDLRTPLGLSLHNNYRYVLNCDSIDPGQLSRMPGWVGFLACDATVTPQGLPMSRGNLDLHDQLSSALIVSPSAEVTDDGWLGNPPPAPTVGTALNQIFVSNTENFVLGTMVTFTFETGDPVMATIESI